jgi:hypothetical protein
VSASCCGPSYAARGIRPIVPLIAKRLRDNPVNPEALRVEHRSRISRDTIGIPYGYASLTAKSLARDV